MLKANVALLKQKQAEIFLKEKKDKKAYAKCYRDLVEAEPDNIANYVTLGDALMGICEPEDAIKAFEQALSRQSAA